MALPIQATPTYTLKIPSSNKTVKFRPFLVKDEKALLIAQQGEDLDVMINTLKAVVASCILDQVDVNSLAIFDLEYIFSQIRAKSSGEISELVFTCGACTEKDNSVKVQLDISKIEVTKTPDHTNKITLFDDVGVMMKYPTIDILKKMEEGFDSIENIIDVVIDCVEIIFNSNEMFYTKELSRKEVTEFVENLTKDQFDKLENFFATMPKYQKRVEFNCPACGKHNSTMLEGIKSFF